MTGAPHHLTMSIMEVEKRQRELPEIFTLYSDSGYIQSDKCNQYWILLKSGVNPPALTVQSDQGNLDGQLNIFSCFREKNLLVRDPADFVESAKINDFDLNWVEYSYQPLENILVTSRLWVPDPNTICGSLEIKNQSDLIRKIQVELAGSFKSTRIGERIAGTTFHGLDVLSGQMGSWHPVIFLSGNTQLITSPYSTLSSEIELDPELPGVLRWIAVLGSSLDDSISKMERVNSLDWAGEISRRKIAAQNQLRIETGDPNWNFAIKLSQKEGSAFYGKNVEGTTEIENSSQRLTPFKALYLLQVLTPLNAEMSGKILNKVLESESEQIHLKNISPLPLLGELIWQITQNHGIWNHLEQQLDLLENILLNWFSQENDQDIDGIPEFIHPSQLNLRDPYLKPDTQLYKLYENTPYLESPGLGALLFNDLVRLKELKTLVKGKKDKQHHKQILDLLRKFVNGSWNSERSCFHNRDRDTHLTMPGRILIQNSREEFIVLRQILNNPSRLGAVIQGADLREIQHKFQLTFHGTDRSGNYRIEEVSGIQLDWVADTGWVFSQTIFTSIDYLTVRGLGKDGHLTIFRPDTSRENISLLLPLWANLLNEKKADSLIKNTITNPDRFWTCFGIRSYPDPEGALIQLPWNMLLIQGLISYGRKQLAEELLTQQMNLIMKNLDRSGCFYSYYDANSGVGSGERNTLEGLIPIGLLLQVMGVVFSSNQKIIIGGEYPFSWPITLRYRGVKIWRDQELTKVDIPGEKTIIIKGSERKLIPWT